MSFVESVKTCLKKYADFSGRATRSEYWWFVLFYGLVLVVASAMDEYGVLLALLALTLPVISVATRRLHDIDKSGWFQLLNIVPLGNFFLLYLNCQKGTAGDNRF